MTPFVPPCDKHDEVGIAYPTLQLNGECVPKTATRSLYERCNTVKSLCVNLG